MPVKLYSLATCPPCRAAIMVCEVLGVEYDLNSISLKDGDHKKPEFLQINPQHNVPVMVDGDFILNESRAIATYLSSKYQKNDTFYPSDLRSRAVVDQRLYFDMGTLDREMSSILQLILDGKVKTISKPVMENLHEILGWVNDFLAPTGYVASTKAMSVADVSFFANISTIKCTGVVPDLDEKYPNIPIFIEKMNKEIPNVEKANWEGAKRIGDFVKSMLKE